MFNALSFLNDYKISYKERSDWIQIECPLCAKSIKTNNYKGAFAESSGAYTCFSCGSHPVVKIIKGLLDCDYSTAINISSKYNNNNPVYDISKEQNKVLEVRVPLLKDTIPPDHNRFLRKRGFNPSELCNAYKLRCIDVDDSYYYSRIFIPTYINNELVSFNTRTVLNDESIPRYLCCPNSNEIVKAKDILYNECSLVSNDFVVVLEGAFDVFKFGYGGVSCLGIKYTQKQVLALSKYKKVFIVFDPEDVARSQARKLASEISLLGTEAYVVNLDAEDGEDVGSYNLTQVLNLRSKLGISNDFFNNKVYLD